jgi:hypothetical protein
MRIYQLTNTGRAFASNPYGDIHDRRWQIIYHLRRRNGQATDEDIIQGNGMSHQDWDVARDKLVQMRPPLIQAIG